MDFPSFGSDGVLKRESNGTGILVRSGGVGRSVVFGVVTTTAGVTGTVDGAEVVAGEVVAGGEVVVGVGLGVGFGVGFGVALVVGFTSSIGCDSTGKNGGSKKLVGGSLTVVFVRMLTGGTALPDVMSVG